MKNKIIAFILAIVMCFSSASIAFAENAPVVKEITLSMYCNLSDKNSITGVYSNKNFYVSAEDLCDVTNGKLKSQTDEETVISCNHSLREITINHSTQKMTDGFIINESFDIPVIEYKGKMYYSLPHFLNLLDYKYEFNQDSETPLKIFADYNIFDAIGDFSKENKKICFSWDEMGCTVKDLEKRIINYGVVALVNRNSDIFKMMFDAKGIEREALEENLITILTSEGEDYLIKDESWLDNLNLENDAFSYGKDTMDFILNTYKSKIGAEYVEGIINETDKYAKPASALVEIANVLATAEQYSSITGTQRKLIEDTILKNADKSPMLQGEWKRMIEAAENVNDRVKSAYENYSAATTEFIENSISDKAKEIMLAEESFAFDVVSPIYYAWKGSLLFTNKLFKPTAKIVEKKTQFYNAYNCSMVQMIARELLVDAVEYLNENGIMVSDIVAQQKNFYQIKNSMILELKSSLATREYLIKSNFLEKDFADEMKELNKQTAILLNKVERCQVVSILPGKLVANDLTWMEKYDEGKIYSRYLLNGGYSELLYDYDDSDHDNYEVESCLVDIDNDNTKELLIVIKDMSNCGVRGYETHSALYGINNGRVILLGSAYYGGGSGGGFYLYLKYDAKLKKHTIIYDGYDRGDAQNVCSNTIVYNTDEKIHEKIEHQENEEFSFDNITVYKIENIFEDGHISYEESIEMVKAETDLYYSNDIGMLSYYRLNAEYVTEEKFLGAQHEFENRYIEPSDESYKLKKVTLDNPIYN